MLPGERDPIGVAHIPEAYDEYNGYALAIPDPVVGDKVRDEIVDYLPAA